MGASWKIMPSSKILTKLSQCAPRLLWIKIIIQLEHSRTDILRGSQVCLKTIIVISHTLFRMLNQLPFSPPLIVHEVLATFLSALMYAGIIG